LRGHPQYRLRHKARFVFAAVLTLLLLTGSGLFAAGYLNSLPYNLGLTDTPPEPDSFKGRINVLVMGVDARKGEKMARADTMMLCSVDTEKNLVSILSIPRDTRVRVPGQGWEKINSTTLFGGPSLAMRTVSDLLGGIKVNNYVITNYDGFKDIVDALGGVTIDVKERMYHEDPQDGGIYTINLKPGIQRLNGDKALQFVRYRGYALGDIGRAEQQQKFLSALVKETLQPSTVIKLPSLIMSLNKTVDTNLSLGDMSKLAMAAAKMNNANMVTQTLPGKFLNIDGGSYWEVDPGQARIAIARMFEGQSSDKVVLGETTVVTSMYKPTSDNKQAEGAIVPGISGQAGVVKDNKNPPTQVDGKTVPKGSGVEVKTGGNTVKAPGTAISSGTNSGATGQASGSAVQSSGGIVPGVSTQGQQPAKNESGINVIIESKTPKKTLQ